MSLKLGRQYPAFDVPPVPAERDDDWRVDAACAQVDPEMFFPPLGSSTISSDARRVCETCPVKTECLEFALAHNERDGIWGGLTERQRRRLVTPEMKAQRLAVRNEEILARHRAEQDDHLIADVLGVSVRTVRTVIKAQLTTSAFPESAAVA